MGSSILIPEKVENLPDLSRRQLIHFDKYEIALIYKFQRDLNAQMKKNLSFAQVVRAITRAYIHDIKGWNYLLNLDPTVDKPHPTEG